MIRKKSKFWTFLFSMIPGAGHMFMGFMKQGVSLMSMFILVIFLASWLNISLLLFILPVLWFYSFFDAINKMSLPDEDFYAQEDYYIISANRIFSFESSFLKKRKLLAGIVLIIFGGYLLWINIWQSIDNLLPGFIRNFIWNINRMVPQLLIGILILGAGVRLVMGKRREMD